jgi:hypothetical protein
VECSGDALTSKSVGIGSLNHSIPIPTKRRSVENQNLSKLVCVKMNAQVVPNSILPELCSNGEGFVEHEDPEVWSDMVAFAEYADTEHEIEIKLARLAEP